MDAVPSAAAGRVAALIGKRFFTAAAVAVAAVACAVADADGANGIDDADGDDGEDRRLREGDDSRAVDELPRLQVCGCVCVLAEE